ncbi:MAG: DsbA family protein [Gammaproteobacteria bacterium]|jgi:putative protein-disulfide isomerase
MTATLHYLYDPLCGWCYGAEPLVNAAEHVAGLTIRLHGGGLWPEPTRLPEETRLYIKEADTRVAAMSGQPYGRSYLEELILDPTLTLESRPTTAAVLAAEKLDANKGLEMLRGIQHAHYERGLKVVEPDVLLQIADEIGLDRGEFQAALGEVDAAAHITNTKRFMQQIGTNGFPTFVLQVGDQWFAVPHRQFASDAEGFAGWLTEMLRRHAA